MEKLISDLVSLINEKSGENLKVYDVSEITTITKFVFIVTANSNIHAQSLTKYVTDALLENNYGQYLMSKNVETNNPWILVDASDIIFHIFEAESREFYNLEKLYIRGICLV